MATFYKFYSFVEAVYEKKHDFASDQFKILLTNTAPSLSWTQKSDVTGELTTGNGYTSGGTNITTTSCTQSTGLLTIIFQDVIFTGTGAGFGPFRYSMKPRRTTCWLGTTITGSESRLGLKRLRST